MQHPYLRKEMTTTHTIIIGCVMSVVLLTYMLASQLAFRRQHAYLDKLPHKRLPLGREDLSQKMHKIVVDESARCESDACSIAPPAPCATSLPADGGWGIPRLAASEDGSALTHFRTSIIKSFIVLEKAFAQRMQMQHQHQHLRGCGAPVLAPATAAIMRCGAVRPLRRCATTCAVCASGCPRYPARSRASTWSITFSEEHISLEAYNQFQALSLNLVVNIKRGG